LLSQESKPLRTSKTGHIEIDILWNVIEVCRGLSSIIYNNEHKTFVFFFSIILVNHFFNSINLVFILFFLNK